MSSIDSISAISPDTMAQIRFKGGGETVGSIAYRGNGGETAGSVAYNPNFASDPNAEYDTYNGNPEKAKKGMSPLGVLIATAGVVGSGILLAGCTHKYGWLSKLPDVVGKHLTSPCETAYNWCKSVKQYGNKGIDWVKNLLSSKKP